MSLTENKRYIFLSVIALLSAWIANHTEILQNYKKTSPAHSPDYFSSGYRKWQMNEQGTLKSTLIADKISHYSDDGTSHTVQPIMTFYNDKTPPWVIMSETGILSADGKNLQLNGQVKIDRAKFKDHCEITINTRNLKVQPETNYAETQEWAELINYPNKTTGIGMNMTYIEPIHIEFLSNVKGNYDNK